jgi:6-phospho-beta-glucosidase
MIKIAVIGGGSTYTPELLDGLLDRGPGLGLTEVALHDVDPARLELVAGFVRRMAVSKRSPLAITTTASLDDAVGGARFIVTQIRVGGNAARREDERLGRRHGLIGQETTGVGGFAKALRTIPPMLAVCEAVEAHAPGAVLINFTNPSGLITELMLRHTNVNAIGLCNIPLTFQLDLARALDAAPADVELDYVGLNHLSWVRGVKLRGKDVTARVLGWADNGAPRLRELAYPPEFIRALGMVPMHYLRYFYLTPAMLAEQNEKPTTRADEVMAIEAELIKLYADPALSAKPELLSRRGGANYSTAALNLIESVLLDRGDAQIVNVLSQGALQGFAPDAVVEAPCRIGKSGARPFPLDPLPPAVAGLTHAIKSYERLTIAAALQQSYGLALLALTAHPLGPDVDRARAVLDDIISTHGVLKNLLPTPPASTVGAGLRPARMEV